MNGVTGTINGKIPFPDTTGCAVETEVFPKSKYFKIATRKSILKIFGSLMVAINALSVTQAFLSVLYTLPQY